MAAVPDARALAEDAARASELRTLSTNPDVVAMGVERVREQVDKAAWTGILLGLAFTMVNVQAFAAGAAAPWSLPWCAAWLLDPMVSLVLIALLRTEQVCARWHVEPGQWVRAGRWFALAATYLMNTWTAWFPNAQGLIPSQVLLHSVPPLLVFFAAEAITDAREGLTSAVLAAERGLHGGRPPTPAPATPDVPEVVREVPEAPGESGDEPETAAAPAVVAPLEQPRRRRIVPVVPRASRRRPARVQAAGAGREAGEPPPEKTGRKKVDARAYYFHLRRRGQDTVAPGDLNAWIGSDSYVKPGDIVAWSEEYARERIGLVESG